MFQRPQEETDATVMADSLLAMISELLTGSFNVQMFPRGWHIYATCVSMLMCEIMLRKTGIYPHHLVR